MKIAQDHRIHARIMYVFVDQERKNVLDGISLEYALTEHAEVVSINESSKSFNHSYHEKYSRILLLHCAINLQTALMKPLIVLPIGYQIRAVTTIRLRLSAARLATFVLLVSLRRD